MSNSIIFGVILFIIIGVVITLWVTGVFDGDDNDTAAPGGNETTTAAPGGNNTTTAAPVIQNITTVDCSVEYYFEAYVYFDLNSFEVNSPEMENTELDVYVKPTSDDGETLGEFYLTTTTKSNFTSPLRKTIRCDIGSKKCVGDYAHPYDDYHKDKHNYLESIDKNTTNMRKVSKDTGSTYVDVNNDGLDDTYGFQYDNIENTLLGAKTKCNRFHTCDLYVKLSDTEYALQSIPRDIDYNNNVISSSGNIIYKKQSNKYAVGKEYKFVPKFYLKDTQTEIPVLEVTGNNTHTYTF
jgi:hypothetical protein